MVKLISAISKADTEKGKINEAGPLFRSFKEVRRLYPDESIIIELFLINPNGQEETATLFNEDFCKAYNCSTNINSIKLENEKTVQLNEMLSILYEKLKSLLESTCFIYVNTQSGTPQFRMALEIIVAYMGKTPNCHLIDFESNDKMPGSLFVEKESIEQVCIDHQNGNNLLASNLELLNSFLTAIKANKDKIGLRTVDDSIDLFRKEAFISRFESALKDCSFDYAYEMWIDNIADNSYDKDLLNNISILMGYSVNCDYSRMEVPDCYISAEILNKQGDYLSSTLALVGMRNRFKDGQATYEEEIDYAELKNFLISNGFIRKNYLEFEHGETLPQRFEFDYKKAFSQIGQLIKNVFVAKNQPFLDAKTQIEKTINLERSINDKVSLKGIPYSPLIPNSACLISFFSRSEPYGQKNKTSFVFDGPALNIFRNNSLLISDVYYIVTNDFVINYDWAESLSKITNAFTKIKSDVKVHFINYGTLSEMKKPADFVKNEKENYDIVSAFNCLFSFYQASKISQFKMKFFSSGSGMPKLRSAMYLLSLLFPYETKCFTVPDGENFYGIAYEKKVQPPSAKNQNSLSAKQNKLDWFLTESQFPNLIYTITIKPNLLKSLQEENYQQVQQSIFNISHNTALPEYKATLKLRNYKNHNIANLRKISYFIKNPFSDENITEINNVVILSRIFNKTSPISNENVIEIFSFLLNTFSWIFVKMVSNIKIATKLPFFEQINYLKSGALLIKEDDLNTECQNFFNIPTKNLNQIEQSFNHEINLKDFCDPCFNDFFVNTFTRSSRMRISYNSVSYLNIFTRPFILPLLRGFDLLSSNEVVLLDSVWLLISGLKHPNTSTLSDNQEFIPLFQKLYPTIRKLIYANFDVSINEAIDSICSVYETEETSIRKWVEKLA